VHGGAGVNELRVIPLPSVAMVKDGDDLVAMFLEALGTSETTLEHRDLVIVTSKVVSKAEGQVVDFDGTEEHKVALIEGESARILRRRGPLRITETHHGFINANAGIDLSNTDDGTAVLLPKDPDRSARRFRAEIQRRCGVEVAVIVTDTFGRVWRVGVTDVAIGSAGVKPVLDLRGTTDATGRVLEVTEVAIADEIAGAANLVLGKAEATPFAIVRGLDDAYFGEGSIKESALRRSNEDLFR
jgi:coenzyme F420-0:L-glutamate ligase/coenzyme F420-1:gamma-L-glutamate ligase